MTTKIFGTGTYTIDKDCYRCHKLIKKGETVYTHESKREGILDWYVCENCHYELMDKAENN
jgi:hypothetical protein